MAIIKLKGVVHPQFLKVRVSNIPVVDFSEPLDPVHLPKGLQIQYRISIEESQVEISCDVQNWDDSLISWVYNRASMMIRTVTDLYSFGTGQPLVVTLDKFVDPSGAEKNLLNNNPHLSQLCSVMSIDNGAMAFGKTLDLVITVPEVALVLRDLISGITFPNTAVIDCARAVEGIRHLIEPNVDKRGSGWGKLQDALNISKAYREYVTGTSANPRHGDKTYIAGDIVTEVSKRSWVIVDRYIELRLRGVSKLPLIDFPLL